jgi:hypothetical protein
MSEAIFANLPRFDSGLVGQPQQRSRIEVMEQEHSQRLEEERLQHQSHFSKQMNAVEETLASLAEKVEKVEDEARRQTAASVASIAERLFPKLSRRFLAEEIAMHLETMIPPGAVCIDIKAEPHLAEQLYEVISRSDRLADICEVVPDETPGGSRVDVSWRSGGLDFDFDGLLEACISRLRMDRPTEGETG